MTGSNAYAVFDLSYPLKARHENKECLRVELRKLRLANQAALLVPSTKQAATEARQVLRSGEGRNCKRESWPSDRSKY
jgi:hypothetical protein